MSEDLRGSVVIKAESSLKRMLVAMTCVSATGLAIWSWLKQKPSFLPAPDSKPGRALLNQYQGITHDIWLVFLLVAAGYLVYLIYTSKQKEKYLLSSPTPGLAESCIRFINKNPLSTFLLAGYALAMISGTTYLYKDLVGWYPDLLKGYFLDNFSIKQSFIAETMRRTDYRFFPLAHQDLHILSWFSIQIKTWMLINA